MVLVMGADTARFFKGERSHGLALGARSYDLAINDFASSQFATFNLQPATPSIRGYN